YEGSNAAARPCVANAEQAAKLTEPTLDRPTLARVLELARLLRRELGDDVPISVPDIQSPFGIAAIIWEKADFLVSLMLAPDTVHELVDKCHRLLVAFLREMQTQIPSCSMAHCPYTWAPPDLGIWLSEDEIGAIDAPTFETFSLPSLVSLSSEFGGMFIHCCADADHQYESLRTIPDLRLLNRRFQHGPRRCMEMFPDVVIAMGWTPEDELNEILDLSGPGHRLLFSLSDMTPEEAKAVMARLRERWERHRSVG
ncbi:MAG: hypothetical protein GF331_07850, partial [Chitinivibrionales bacterium]|nr:hypothetical protein [Chitinivibrionales bacterium]